MRSALLCVFFTLIVQREGNADDDGFRPIPIPLSEYYEHRQSRAGTLQEIQTADPPVAAIPAHYWEDALRHSVYLTLVRDKIDQLIAKGDVISPNSSEYVSKEVDDHDLWDKIKTAPFDRVKEEEPAILGDVTVMANGRLIEEERGYRFLEDERTKEKCTDEKCMEGVKAAWSVKRVRQREAETIPGKYHYELTFSVVTAPKRKRKPYENPTRTFTVRETAPETVEDSPQENFRQPVQPLPVPVQVPATRPQRAVWVHKNIVPSQRNQGRQYSNSLERIFSSWFSDDDDDEKPQRYRYIQPQPSTGHPQYSKVGYVGSSSEQYHQKKIIPYPYKQHVKYVRPPIPPQSQPPTQHHYLDIDAIGVVSNPSYVAPNNEHRYVVPPKPYKQYRPSVYQTSPDPIPPPTTAYNETIEEVSEVNLNATEEITTRAPEVVTASHNHNVHSHHITHYRPKHPLKVNYFSDHVRPPVYNAPPGVFVTMDKKPFKPMPPLRLVHSSKPSKHKPIDFRPSPQVLDGKFSEPDPMFDSAFRPITVNYNDTRTTTESIETESVKPDHKPKKSNRPKKPPKKNEFIKGLRITTSAPEIITAHSYSNDGDTLQWADVLGAFSKTTPMASQKVKFVESMTTTSTTTTTTTPAPTTTKKKLRTTTTTETPTTTTIKLTKRTRPPHKFKKPENPLKHKRITTTTQEPEKEVKKATNDLTPQASSAATSTIRPWWKNLNKTLSTTTTTTTTTTSTTTSPPSTSLPSSTTEIEGSTSDSPLTLTSTQPKIKNRFRQSTLMQKGTSVNHDKWSAQASPNEKSKTQIPTSGVYPPRRKGSNFQGYVSPSAPRRDKEHNKDDHTDRPTRPATAEPTTVKLPESTRPTQPTYEDTADQYDSVSDSVSQSYNQINNKNQQDSTDSNIDQDEDDNEDTNAVEESRDHTEYIFTDANSLNDRNNEIVETEEPTFTEKTIVTTPYEAPKNITKCKKKKKVENLTTTEEPVDESEEFEDDITTTTTSSTTTTEKTSTPDIFEELLGGFTFDDLTQTEKSETVQPAAKPDLQEQQSIKAQQFVKIDDDLEEFLDSLEGKGKFQYKHADGDHEEEYDEEDDDDQDSEIDDDESTFDEENDAEYKRESRDAPYMDYEEPSRPLSLLELIAME